MGGFLDQLIELVRFPSFHLFSSQVGEEGGGAIIGVAHLLVVSVGMHVEPEVE